VVECDVVVGAQRCELAPERISRNKKKSHPAASLTKPSYTICRYVNIDIYCVVNECAK
jgi:hypothetical protein